MKRFLAPLFLAAMGFTALFYSASAHAEIDRCTPAPGTAIAVSPQEVRCWFTEEIEDKTSTLTVLDANGVRVDNGDGHVDLFDPDHKQMFATVKSLSPGVYKVVWHAVTSDDNGVADGTWYFGIGQVAVPAYSPPTKPAAAPALEATLAAVSPTAVSVAQAASPTAAPTVAATAIPATVAPTTAAATAIAPTAAPTAAATVAATTIAPTPPAETPASAATSSGTVSLVVGAGILQALVLIGVLAYLFRKYP